VKLNKKLLLLTAVLALAFAVSACGGTAEQPLQPDEQVQQNGLVFQLFSQQIYRGLLRTKRFI